MDLYKEIKHPDDNEILPFKEDNFEEEAENKNEHDSENIEELEEIEAKLEKGEDVAISVLESMILQKSKIVYCCPRCKKIYLNNKWVKDNITDIYAVRTELAYCPKCIGKTYDNFVGSLEIYNKNLAELKKDIIEIAHCVERELEEAPHFEKIINISEKKGILFIFVNTTRLALEIGKRLRQEIQGGVQYEWFERNQFLRVKWYDNIDELDFFKESIKSLKNKRFSLFSFEEED